MKAVVVYESFWGNTAAVARAIAEGLGDGACAMSTTEATPAVVAEADLLVAGAPLIAFALPTDQMRATIARDPGRGAPTPDVSHPSMRTWLSGLPAGARGGSPAGTPAGTPRCAAFETRISWSPGSAAGAIDKAFRAAGYMAAARPHKFVVSGKFGPLKEGELQKARAWGAELAGK